VELEVRRGRTGDPRGVVGTSGTDKPKAVTGEDICGEGDPFGDVPPILVPQGLCHHHQERLTTDYLHGVRRRRLW
jgi:hypothetical protein